MVFGLFFVCALVSGMAPQQELDIASTHVLGIASPPVTELPLASANKRQRIHDSLDLAQLDAGTCMYHGNLGALRGKGRDATQRWKVKVRRYTVSALTNATNPNFGRFELLPPATEVVCAPSLLVLGCMKGGTEEVLTFLQLHPSMTGSYIELHFFDKAYADVGDGNKSEHNVRKYIESYSFAMSKEAALAGHLTFEKSPSYLFMQPVAERIKKLLPSVHMLALLRDPIARAYSNFWHDCRSNRARRYMLQNCSAAGFHEVVVRCTAYEGAAHSWENISAVWKRKINDRRFGLIALHKSMYARQLANYLSFFPRTQLTVLLSESFFSNSQSTMDKVFADLNLEPFTYDLQKNDKGRFVLSGSLGALSKAKNTHYTEKILPETVALLRPFYADEVRRLKEMFPELAGPIEEKWDTY